MSQATSIQEQEDQFAWAAQFSPHGGPRYLQIADFIEQALSDGRLAPGDRLPPQRLLAARLRVDLTTITRGYDEAKRRHLLEGRGARGTYAAAPKVELAPMLDLSMNIPPPPAGVDFNDMLKQGLAQVLMRSDSDMLMTYHLGGGSQAERAAGAAWLAPQFGTLDPEHIVVCPGAQSALAALILALSQPGEVILAEPTIYPGLRTAAEQLGRRVVAVPADEHGMLPDAMEYACNKHGARLVYLNPTLQNPTALSMPAERRRALAAAVQRCGASIIEDDPYWLLAADAPPPLARHAPAKVCYIATLSKCLAPGLRTAFVLLPDALLRERVLNALRSFSLMATPLATALMAQWIHDGTAQQLLDGVRQEARARQQLAHQLLAGGPQTPGEGIHLWLPLPSYWTARELANTARAEGLSVTPSGAFQIGGIAPNAIRVSLGSIRERARFAAALRKLSQLLSRRPAGGQVVV
ncbi:PLP-dependent aminotransferase family protein [Rugamonas sp. CCM 8940]|uniref:aminotransferase-like domain-containing protein n=1 Tax=Rugamonas sp. CCM 8940 TaxID=2765359 RepID=UPI0018F6BCCD|nr:PLP-dependent aminotransferase family protein [Rugamonas sp. CCM 8940]MBJ7312918.1 PLP-dependent aminotransferase family protein [Rugamonas sp. CCM 8940]